MIYLGQPAICLGQVEEKTRQGKQRIAFTDKKTDALVYELYGLSEEEVKVVKGENEQ